MAVRKSRLRSAFDSSLDALDLRSLKVFLCVVEAGGMTQAAQILGMSQSAVSQSVAGVERSLGVRLLNREVRPMDVTLSGRVLADHARRLIEGAQEAVARVREPMHLKLPRLRLALADSLAAAIGAELLIELRSAVRHCMVWSGLSTTHRDALLAHKVDVIISAEPFEDTAGLQRHEILSERFLLLLPRTYPSTAITLHKLLQHGDLIRFSARSSTGIRIERHLQRHRLQAPLRFEFDTADVVFAMVASGLGWAITSPLCLLQAPQRLAGTQIVPLPGAALMRRVTVLYRSAEFSPIAGQITALARTIVRTSCLPRLGEMTAWLTDLIAIDGSAPK